MGMQFIKRSGNLPVFDVSHHIEKEDILPRLALHRAALDFGQVQNEVDVVREPPHIGDHVTQVFFPIFPGQFVLEKGFDEQFQGIPGQMVVVC